MTPSMSRPYARTRSDILSLATQSCLISVMAPSSGASLRYASSQAISSSTASPRNSSLSYDSTGFPSPALSWVSARQ